MRTLTAIVRDRPTRDLTVSADPTIPAITACQNDTPKPRVNAP
jgi:hypothetical protein